MRSTRAERPLAQIWRTRTVVSPPEPGNPGAVGDREETSASQMAILEETLPPELNVLLEKVLSDRVPSIHMLRRIQRIAATL